MLTLASYLAENVQPLYERLATWLAARFGEPATLLDDGRVHVAYLCGWLYAQRHDRPERSVDLLCAARDGRAPVRGSVHLFHGRGLLELR